MSARPTAHPPFGRVEQRELEYMRLLRFEPLNRLLFAVLRVRYDARTGTVSDRISTLADWSGMSERKVQYCLRNLARRGVISRERHRSAGGPVGCAWSWSTTVRPYDDWPVEPLAVLVAASIAYLSVFHGAEENTHDLRALPAKRTHHSKGEDAQNARRERTGTRHYQASSPDISQERDASFDECDDEDARSHDPRRLRELWVTLRADAELHRFLDDTALRWLTERVPEAVRAGCSAEDLERAVRRHAEVAFADPRNFLEWAVAERDDRLRSERDRERSCAFVAEREREQVEFERRRAEPGFNDEVGRILANTRARLRAGGPSS